MARGFLSDPGKASFLEIACPTEEAAMALCGVARRLGIQAKHRTLRSSERVTLKDPDAIERMRAVPLPTRPERRPDAGLPMPDPGIDPNSGNGPMGPGIGM